MHRSAMQIERRLTRHLTQPVLLLAALAAAGCGADPLASTSPHAPAPELAVATSGVITTQLRAFPGTTSYAWGHLQLTLGGTAADPCGGGLPLAADAPTTVALCGKIFNQGGATFTGDGGLYRTSGVELDASLLLVASFQDGAHPPSPCRRYDVGGTITVSSDVATDIVASPADYVVLFEGLHPPSPIHPPAPIRLLGGSLDGQAWGPVGSIPSTDVFYTQNVCDLQLAPSP